MHPDQYPVAAAVACSSALVALGFIVLRRHGSPLRAIALPLVITIVLCGTMRLFDLVAAWRPMYELGVVARTLTGAIAIGTVAVMWPRIPRMFTPPGSAKSSRDPDVSASHAGRALGTPEPELERDLEGELEGRRQVEAELRRVRGELEALMALKPAVQSAVQAAASAAAVARWTREEDASRERMMALGTLAAGLGHDMGNLLLPMRVHLESIQTGPAGALVAEELAAIGECLGRLRRLATGLSLLSRDPAEGGGGEGDAVVTDLACWWSEVGPFYRNILAREIALEFEVEPGTPAAAVAPHRLTQAVFNLVQNAGEAIAASGRKRGCVRITGREEGGGVRVVVADDGAGMTAEVQTRCVEPYFSTKTRAISTGLGLAIVEGIVGSAGGSMAIDSRPGEGTTVTLTLGGAVGRMEEEGGAAGTRRRRAVVTIGDGRVRGFVRDLLGELGYDVEIADGPGLFTMQSRTSGRGAVGVERMNDGGTGGAGPEVWVTDGGAGAATAAERLLRGSPRAQIVVVGGVGRGMAGEIAAGGRVRVIEGEGFSPGRLRDGLRATLEMEGPPI